jgi:hypothetical protein
MAGTRHRYVTQPSRDGTRATLWDMAAVPTRTLRSAPAPLRIAVCLFVAELVGFAVIWVVIDFKPATAPQVALAVILAAVPVALLAAFATLAFGLVFGRHRLRRYREALLFQSALLVICVLSLGTHPTPYTATLGALATAIIALLLHPSARRFVQAATSPSRTG